VEPGLAGHDARQQLDVEPLDQRILQQDLLLGLDIVHIERFAQSSRQPTAEVVRVERAGIRHLDLGDGALDDIDRHDPAADILIGNDRPGIEVAALDIEKRQAAADLLKVAQGRRLVEVGGCDRLD
jgi:hypothetical protein